MSVSKKELGVVVFLILAISLIWVVATYCFLMEPPPPPKTRGVLIVLVRAPGDTVSFVIPPEAERHAKGEAITF